MWLFIKLLSLLLYMFGISYDDKMIHQKKKTLVNVKW